MPFTLDFVEPKPLDLRVLDMVKTNVFGSIEARIYYVENWDITKLEKAQACLLMFPKLDSDDQRKLAHAMVKYVEDANYLLLRTNLLNPVFDKRVLSVLMTDTLKRGYRIKVPTLLSLAQTDSHPMQSEARQLLKQYLHADHGTNWLEWEESMVAWLAKYPR